MAAAKVLRSNNGKAGAAKAAPNDIDLFFPMPDVSYLGEWAPSRLSVAGDIRMGRWLTRNVTSLVGVASLFQSGDLTGASGAIMAALLRQIDNDEAAARVEYEIHDLFSIILNRAVEDLPEWHNLAAIHAIEAFLLLEDVGEIIASARTLLSSLLAQLPPSGNVIEQSVELSTDYAEPTDGAWNTSTPLTEG